MNPSLGQQIQESIVEIRGFPPRIDLAYVYSPFPKRLQILLYLDVLTFRVIDMWDSSEGWKFPFNCIPLELMKV